jgi:hypothetical protein
MSEVKEGCGVDSTGNALPELAEFWKEREQESETRTTWFNKSVDYWNVTLSFSSIFS